MRFSGSSLLILLSLLTLASCGEKKSNGKKIISLNEERLERFVEELKFECESLNGEKCPDGIARLVIYNKENPAESALCSGFLIKKNVLVTNNHCVSTATDCENTYINIYTEKSTVKTRCDSIIHTEVDHLLMKKKNIDLTVLKLKIQDDIPFFQMSSLELRPEDKVRSWVIDHISGRQARITELECYFESNSTSLRLRNCPIIQGNSGSPLVDHEGKVLGLIWGSTVDEAIDASFPLDQRRDLQDYGFATAVDFFREFAD